MEYYIIGKEKRMANPQLEQGHTRIAHELLEAICSKITNSIWIRILLWTARLTYGWRRKETESNYQAYATKLNLTKDTIKHTMLELNDRKIVIYIPLTSEKFIISINKDYDLWKTE